MLSDVFLQDLRISGGTCLPLLKLLVSSHGVRRIHERRSPAHEDRHAKGLLDLLKRGTKLNQGFDVKAYASIAMCGNSKRKRDQFLGFPAQRTVCGCRLRQR